MNWCGIHRSLSIGSNHCLHCRIERLESEIQVDWELQNMFRNISKEVISDASPVFISQMRESMIKVRIELARMYA